MAGINRLGKGSAKPGTLRPTDPNRFKTEDFFSVDAEDDPEYLRRVIEVEQLAINKTGAVLSKGAFDRNDALYLKDEAERARHEELERRDVELAQFARARHKLEQSAAMEPYDPGPALKRPKFVKSKVPVRKKVSAGSTKAQNRATNQPQPASSTPQPSKPTEPGKGPTSTTANTPSPPAATGNAAVPSAAPATTAGAHTNSRKPGAAPAKPASAQPVAGKGSGGAGASAMGLGLQYSSSSDEDSEDGPS